MNVEPLRSGDPRGVGRYEFLGRLGAGGMGLVCLGRGPDGRLVAVKLIHEEIAADSDYRRRFAREVRAAATVHARFTAAIVDADPHAPRPWYAAQYIDGPTLGHVVRRDGPLAEPALRALAAGLAEAVAAFETAGVVHRDLKPDNILLAADGPKVIDFGIARGENDSVLTRAGSILGSPGYMSPEQIVGERATTASDVFALGAVLAFAGQGSGAFGDGQAEVRMYMTKFGEPRLAGVPPALRRQVQRCLAKTPRDRPTPRELVSRWSVRADELDTLIEVGRGPRPEVGGARGIAGQVPGAEVSDRRALWQVPSADVGAAQAADGRGIGAGHASAGPSAEIIDAQAIGGARRYGAAGSRAAVGAGGPNPVPAPAAEPPTYWLPATSATPPSAPIRFGDPLVAREWRPSRPPRPWWHQAVAVDRLPGGFIRDLLAGIAAAALLAVFSLPDPNTALTIAFAATALALGFLLGVRRSLLTLAGYSAAALAGVEILPDGTAASLHDPSFGILLDLAVLLLLAGGVARVGGMKRQPVLCFAVGFAAYIAGRAVAMAWLANRTGVDFPATWRAGTDGLLIYRDAAIAALLAATVGLLALIGSSKVAVGVDGPYRATGVHR
ncbi:MAG: protein kinase [Catenulisporales bacterium]|nr:protein kinase [Catenulisporales bacterium]